jgi:DNA topoisomerase-1
MPKNLVIVESPGKIRTIQKFLGNDFSVKATIGHCFEIEPNDNAIDIKNGFKTEYSIIKGKKTVLDEIKKIAKECEIVYIATDGDREGEAIGFQVANYLNVDKKIKRAKFYEITKQAVLNAIANPGVIDTALVHAQQARSVLDRLVGYKVSPVLWRYVASKTSAGRVQSVGLRLIVDRQQEIDAFKIEEYWTIAGDFLSLRKDKFTANYSTKEKHKNKEETDSTLESINKVSKWIIKEISKVKRDRMPLPVFQTSTLQQFCSTTFGWPAKKTMSAAQSVYEAGLITYHRTDCTNISQEAITIAREIIKNQFGDKYLPEKPNVFKSKSNAQEAHEGIRPSHLEYSLDEVKKQLTEEQFKLYEAIYRRFISCQMTKAEFNNTKVTIMSNDSSHSFTANGQILIFDGFLKVYTYSTSKETILPELNENEEVKLDKVSGEQHFTKPPPQFNDASLVKTLEEKGIGRPSTYATIIETLKRRLYVEEDKKAFRPTDLGKKVCEFLVKAFPELLNPNFTARVEEQLDEIANNKKEWQNVVGDFWIELEKYLKTCQEIGKELRSDNETEILCPECKKNKLVKRFGKYGAFYGCGGFRSKECSAIFKIGENDEPIKIEKKEKKYIEGKKCKCGGKIVIRTSKNSGKEFGGCENFPTCKKIYTLEGELIERRK